jgi:transposase InsO family protein
MKGDYPITLLCEVLGVARSGYYRWRQHSVSARQRRDGELAAQIATAHRRGRGAYGAPRIVRELRDQGTPISQRRCARLMRELGLRGKKRHRRKPRTTDSRHGQKVPANQLAARPAPTGPDQIWVTDITSVKTGEGWVFLVVFLDLWSRQIVGWACAATLHASLVLAGFLRAVAQRHPPTGLLHHSDRGGQYVDHEYIRLLAAAGVQRSMSAAGNCYDNAFAESFFSTLKTESGIEEKIPATRRDAELAIFDYIETFYNSTRRHSSLGYLSPVAFENQHKRKDTKAA